MCSRPGQPAAATVAPRQPSSEALCSPPGAAGIARGQARNEVRAAIGDHGSGLSWTVLGLRMGFTSEQRQRIEISAAVSRMEWTERPAQHQLLGGSATRAVAVAATCRRPRPRLHRIGVADLGAGRRLIGLENTAGVRSFVLCLGTEVIHVLTTSLAASPAPPPFSARPYSAVEQTR